MHLRKEEIYGWNRDRITCCGVKVPSDIQVRPGSIDRVGTIGQSAYTSAQVPTRDDGAILCIDKLGKEMKIGQADDAAELCALNCLGTAEAATYSLDDVD